MKKYIAPSFEIYYTQADILAGSLVLGDSKPTTDDTKNIFSPILQDPLEEDEEE